jgi:type I restriction enzyme M protein
MYLHKFTNPKINEYDTLSSEDRWNEYYDVILANPPFFSPKGGITPHNRFGVKSTKAEVLFVDYINEHLKPNGRAGIIVPEGIIFQGGTAYKQLRKRLIETSLIGVVSLPAGVFQPYSGVKTSILILDKGKSKKIKEIFFVKIDNDGYSLNSNRNKINDNDFPNTILNIKNDKNLNKIQKINLLNADDISFVPSKYIEEKVNKNLKFSRIKISEITDIFSGSRDKGGSLDKGIPSIGGGQIGKNGDILNDKMVFVSEKHFNSMNKGHLQNGDILIVKDGATTGKIGFYKGEFLKASINEHIFALRTKKNYNNYFLYYLLQGSEFQKKLKPFIQGIIGGINLKFSSIEIPHPSREIQNQIVEELVGYQKIIDGCRQVIGNYKPSIDIDPTWKMVNLNDICDVRDGTHNSPKYVNKGYPLITSKNVINGSISFEKVNFINQKDFDDINKRSKVDIGDILMPMIGTIGRPTIVKMKTEFAIKNVALIKTKNKISQEYVRLVLDSKLFENYLKYNMAGSTQKFLSLSAIREFNIPIPPKDIEKKLIENINEEELIVSKNKDLIARFQSKIKNKIDNIWTS